MEITQILLTRLDNFILAECIKRIEGVALRRVINNKDFVHPKIVIPIMIALGRVNLTFDKESKLFIGMDYKRTKDDLRSVAIPKEHRINNIFKEYFQ